MQLQHNWIHRCVMILMIVIITLMSVLLMVRSVIPEKSGFPNSPPTTSSETPPMKSELQAFNMAALFIGGNRALQRLLVTGSHTL